MKRHFARNLSLVAVAALALSACGGGGGVSSPAIPAASSNPTVNSYSGPAALSYTWNSDILKGAHFVGPLTGDGPMTIHVALRMRNEVGLLQYAQNASNPHSASYRRFLTPQEIGTQFGASASDVSSAASYFKSNGLTFSTWPQHLTGVVHGMRSAMEKAFGVTFGVYNMGGVPFVAPSGGSPHFSTAVPVSSAMLASNVNVASRHRESR